MIDQFYRGRDQLQRDEAIRSCGIAAQSLMLSAVAMGYDTCPMVGYDPARVAHVINMPADHIVTLMIAVGKKLKDAQPRSGQLYYDDVVHMNMFPNSI